MESPYDPTGSAPWVQAWREGDDLKFMIDLRGNDCYHTVKSAQFPALIAAIGQPVGTEVSAAVASALSANVQAVVDAVHSDLSSTDFSWMSMSDIESMVGDI